MSNGISLKGTFGNSIVIESGGLNEEYIRWFYKKLDVCNWKPKRFFLEEWDNQGLNKLNACLWVIQNGVCIWCDQMRFPTMKKQIEDCSWDPEATEP